MVIKNEDYFNKKKESRKRWKRNNPEKVKEAAKRYRLKHKDKLNSYFKNYFKTHRKVKLKMQMAQKARVKSPTGLFSIYQTNARRRFILWDLTFDQFMRFWRRPCAYCGAEIETIGLDRKINSEGYNLENVVPCCTKCNRMKSSMNKDEFLHQCRKILANYDFHIDY
jgi:hypothetical protein